MGWPPIVELRQYTLVPGKRDVLVDLFEVRLVEAQEDCGMRIIGTFRDLDDATKFVWFRGFQSMGDRGRALREFYGGPVWQSIREEANATMVDSDDVLLLRPARANRTFTVDANRPPLNAPDGLDRGIAEAVILNLDAPASTDTLAYFDDEIAPRIASANGSILACLVTEHRKNDFPLLPVREGENVLLWLAGFGSVGACDAAREARDEVFHVAGGTPRLISAPLVLRLIPTRRSLLTGAT